MPIESKSQIERDLEESVRRTKRVMDEARAIRAAALLPEPDVSPRNVTIQPAQTQGPGRGNAR